MATLRIAQKESPRPGVRPRVLELDGPAGPQGEIPWGLELRASVRRYPGANSAVLVEGPSDKATDFSFIWKGREIGGTSHAKLDGAPLVDVDDLVARLDSIVRDGVLCDFTWGWRERVGLIVDMDPREGPRAYEWVVAIRVEWAAVPESPTFLDALVVDHRSTLERIRDAVNSGVDAANRVAHTASSAPAAWISGVTRDVESLREVNLAAERLIKTPERAAGEVSRLSRATGALLASYIGVSDALMTSITGPAGMVGQSDDPLVQYRARVYSMELARAAREARYRAALAMPSYAQDGDRLGVHTAVEGETIWSVSRLWYGDTSGVLRIARANDLDDTEFAGGERLTIPRAEAG